MAEKACHDGLPRRPSFRKTLADHADAGLPEEYLEALEQKRKQLDESIHKYIAAKEREFRQYEKELKQQRKLAGVQESASKPRRTSSESTQDTLGSPRLLGQQQSSVVDVLLAAGLRREQIGQSVALAVVDDDGPEPTLEATKASAGLTDRRASTDRNKDFIGVFTPAFLPALESNNESGQERSASAPALDSLENLKRGNEDGHRANSDTAIDALSKRPPHLQLVQRSPSSGSSADNKLTSALKSPTQQSKSKQKRVSLAVGDTIVAPSDNVPVSMSNNSTPSHSRTRAPIPEREAAAVPQSFKASEQPQSIDTALSAKPTQTVSNGTIPKADRSSKPASPPLEATPSLASAVPPTTNSPRKIDPDGDLFDLHDEDDPPMANEDPFESDDEVTGRVNSEAAHLDEDEMYDSNAGLIPDGGVDAHAEHVEFMPGSAVASQQPTNPGFRRPSASYDPVYRGSDYEKAEENAANNEIYGSSFNRPSNKGSFTAGSVGESFMAQNAERMMRRARDQAEVRS